MKLDYKKTLLIGLGLFGITVVGKIYSLFVPIFLQAGNPQFDVQSHVNIPGFGLNATLTGVFMTVSQIAPLFIFPIVGVWSDRTRTRVGRRYPFILIAAPVGAAAFAMIPVTARMISPGHGADLAANLLPFVLFSAASAIMLVAMAFWRTPVVALMPDVVPSSLRSKANGVINCMGGLGGVIAGLGLAALFDVSPSVPFMGGAALLVMAVAILFLTVKEPELPPLAASPPRTRRWRVALDGVEGMSSELRRNVILLMLAILLWFAGHGAINTFFSSYAVTKLGLTAGMAGQVSSMSLILYVPSTLAAGVIGTRIGRRRAITLGLGVSAVVMIVAYLLPSVIIVASVLAIGGAAWALVIVNALPMMVDMSDDPGLVGTYTGLYYLASQTASLLSPIANGFIVDLAGGNYSAIFLSGPAFYALSIVCMSLVNRGEARSG